MSIAFLVAFALVLVLALPPMASGVAAQTSCAPSLFSNKTPSTNQDCTAAATTTAATLPSNFQESIVFSGLDHPTAIRFARDGRVFVAQKNGVIKVFASLTASTATTFADLSTAVDNYWDRGLLGLELDPNFPTNPYVYVLYTFDAPIDGTAPTWNDACPTPPGPTTDGCLVSGRLSRLTADASGNTMVPGGEQVFINEWCQQFPSHSIGQLFFGPDGALYVSGGDGASFNNVDYGQYGNTYAGDRLNPCGDPTAEGGALRSQSLKRTAREPVLLDGAILRVDPASGLALPTNPLYGNSDANAKRIVGYGLRNPFRFTFRPGTNELWVGDVGWGTWEEINRITAPTAAPVTNFGWPCYEGNNIGSAIQSGYQGANLNICNNLYNTAGSVTAPYYAYQHGVQVVSGETCPTGNGSVISGLTFYNGGSYPTSYNGALFFGDHSRNCIWVMSASANGLPDKTKIANFVTGAANPVDLEIGPGGDLFYVDYDGGTIRRIQYVGAGNQPPVAVISANPTSGAAPLTVNFDGTGSYDLDPGDGITAYSWDLNGDGIYGDSTSSTTSYTYNTPGTYTASLKVTDKHNATNTSSAVITANNTAPQAFIDTPAACPSNTPCWAVGDTINFSGHATDGQEGTLPAADLSWTIILHHCTTDLSSCHTHSLQTYSGVSGGSFVAPDHEYPAYLEIQLTATDSGGLQNTASVLLYPTTVNLSFNSSPSGLQLVFNGTSIATRFSRTVIAKSNNSVSAPSQQVLGGTTYEFTSWSDSPTAPATRTIVADTTATYTANYIDTIPAAPSNLRASPVSGLQINLTWSDNATTETGFKIERCTGSGCTNFVEVGSVGTNVTSYADTGLIAKTTYRYRVRAYHNTYYSAYSNTASAKTRPR
jgi:glucose/arabinose dehydrogenase